MKPGKLNPNWKGGLVALKCVKCQSEFFVIRSRLQTAKFCSRICHNRSNAEASRQKALEKFDSVAKKTKITPDFVGNYTRLAPALKCQHITKKGRQWCQSCAPKQKTRDRTCAFCGKAFLASYPSSKKKTCSDICSRRNWSQRQVGEKSHRWEGGKTQKNTLLRNDIEYKMWREEVFNRDNFTCVLCKERGGNLTADHIKPWALYPALRFDVENGRTLCRHCHGLQPTTGTKLVRAMAKERKANGGVQLRIF